MPYTHLTEKERYVISHLIVHGLSIREVGRRLNRSHATISREIKRNRPGGGVYWYHGVDKWIKPRKAVPRHKRRQHNDRLMRYVTNRLKRKWSPEQIANRLTVDYPDDLSMRFSHEGIYQWIYKQSKTDEPYHQFLRRGRKTRRRQVGYGAGRGLIADRRSIHERPICVDLRKRFGDWEGDTILGKQGSGAIVTLIERKSLYLLAGKLESKSAEPLSVVSNRKFQKLPTRLKQTLTVDNGKEFADFKNIEKRSQLTVYFADPYASWQRGCNENINGLLRQYFPKGSNFKSVTDKAVENAVRCLNNRPRKSLNYRTPSEVMHDVLSGAL